MSLDVGVMGKGGGEGGGKVLGSPRLGLRTSHDKTQSNIYHLLQKSPPDSGEPRRVGLLHVLSGTR